MKKLSKITEGVWGSIRNRVNGDIVRQEDAFNPDYIDFGENTTVYWMQDNLQIDGKVKFPFDDVKDYNNNGWRLPTKEEVEQLNWDGVKIQYKGFGFKYFVFPDGNKLKIWTNGNGGTRLWSSEIVVKYPTGAYAYGINNAQKYTVDPFNRGTKLFVFLVKDKNYINESTWGDIRNRVSGDAVRKEDDINIMDKESFFNYLCKNYISLGEDQEITTGLDSIIVTAYKDERERRHYLIYDNVDKIKGESKISLHITSSDGLFNKLKRNYILLEHPTVFSAQYIYPNDGEVTNEFFLNVLNFILDNVSYCCDKVLRKKNGLNESTWGDIRNRVNGDAVRKEDEFNSMDGKQFYDYLQKHYNTLSKEQFHIDENFHQYTIGVPLLKKDKTPFYLFINSYKDNDYCFLHMSSSFQTECHKLYYEKLKDNYIFDIDLVDSGSSRFGWFVEISTKDKKKKKNDFVIEVIDFILSQIENPFIKLIEKI